ncbi:MAG: hypothetical protein FJ303_24630 [Planctomycetes bacterium]|nr:hypothetical protein [Planctomycetota bacterium]
MHFFRYALVAVLLVLFGVAVYQTLVWRGLFGNRTETPVKPLDWADQEIALIEPATSTDDWGRIVTAIRLIEKDWSRLNPSLPALRLELDDAFPPLTADIPEVALYFADTPNQKLRLRWYKISGENEASSWVAKLHARSRPPLAIIGGGTSGRAVKLADVLARTYPDPSQTSPVFLITTATSERTTSGRSLIDIYGQRTFRFSFTNQKMVEALLAFVGHREFPEKEKEWAQGLWVHKQAESIPTNAPPARMFTVTWEDERYSQDMNELFASEFKTRYPKGEFIPEGNITSSSGGFFQPTAQEQTAVDGFLQRRAPVMPHSLLVLPTQTVRMRRFLLHLRQRSVQDARNLVIFNGDAVSFHSIYRDREVMWNILDLPYSLIFFSHRNPIDTGAGFRWTRNGRDDPKAFPQQTTTGTHDILLLRDLFESTLYAAFDAGQLLSDPLQVRDRLKATAWYHPPADAKESPRVINPRVHRHAPPPPSLFDARGNRQSRTGEHIIWVKPTFTGDVVDLESKISVWSVDPNGGVGVWRLVESSAASYIQSRVEEVK